MAPPLIAVLPLKKESSKLRLEEEEGKPVGWRRRRLDTRVTGLSLRSPPHIACAVHRARVPRVARAEHTFRFPPPLWRCAAVLLLRDRPRVRPLVAHRRQHAGIALWRLPSDLDLSGRAARRAVVFGRRTFGSALRSRDAWLCWGRRTFDSGLRSLLQFARDCAVPGGAKGEGAVHPATAAALRDIEVRTAALPAAAS